MKKRKETPWPALVRRQLTFVNGTGSSQ
ncbi:unnamed protein product [Menidia menidia]|uniref:(Atlantic silverside) hypothetical protein n=1 Tax=Menidia menidia TaxID=238744 RepID=A0A8S4BUV0_9TELE|nr:unnamed protein product [Menidia menidia]